MMPTNNCKPAAELIPVVRRPHLAKRIPVVASAKLDERSEQLNEKWRGTTPQGRELIRKHVWAFKRQMLAAKAEFDDHWQKINTQFPKDLYAEVLSVQDRSACERVAEHLSRTQQWPAYRASVERISIAFELIKGWPDYKRYIAKVECLKFLVGESPMNSGREQAILRNKANSATNEFRCRSDGPVTSAKSGL